MVKICFFPFDCWKCNAPNHIYYAYWLNNEYSNSQHFHSDPGNEDTLWNGTQLAFKPVTNYSVLK